MNNGVEVLHITAMKGVHEAVISRDGMELRLTLFIVFQFKYALGISGEVGGGV